jgi:predicted ATPase
VRLGHARGPIVLLERSMGADAIHPRADANAPMMAPFVLREPNKPGLERYVDTFALQPDVEPFFAQLRAVQSYSSRAFQLQALKRKGSETSSSTTLEPQARNLWSVLRNLKERRSRDARYDTICGFMRQAFPGGFDDLEFEQAAPTVVYASMLEPGRRQPIKASGISDGHLQMLVVLTAIFGGNGEHPGLLLFDEPEISLHPWPLAVMAYALRTAAQEQGRQVVLATHSPVMISQFESHELLVAEKLDGAIQVRRLDEIADVQDLLEQFAAGSIYMAQAVAPQGGEPQYLPGSRR